MAHRAHVIEVVDDLGMPAVLSKIITEYAELSNNERLERMFQFDNMVTIACDASDEFLDGDDFLFVQRTSHGIEISCSLTGDVRQLCDSEHFVKCMKLRYIDLDLVDDNNSCAWDLETDVYRLTEKLIEFWWSI